MAKNKLPRKGAGKSVEELVELFDTHDMGDYLAKKPKVEFDIRLKKRRHLISIDPELAASVTKIARNEKVSSETLIDSWLREKVSERKPTVSR